MVHELNFENKNKLVPSFGSSYNPVKRSVYSLHIPWFDPREHHQQQLPASGAYTVDTRSLHPETFKHISLLTMNHTLTLDTCLQVVLILIQHTLRMAIEQSYCQVSMATVLIFYLWNYHWPKVSTFISVIYSVNKKANYLKEAKHRRHLFIANLNR